MKKHFILIFICIVNLGFSQDLKVEFLKKQKKIGLIKGEKIIIIPKYDSIKLKKGFNNNSLQNYYEAYNNQQVDVFNIDGKIIISNLRAVASLNNFISGEIQVVDSLSQTYFIDSLGRKKEINDSRIFFNRPELLNNDLDYDAIVTCKIVSSNKMSCETIYYDLIDKENKKPVNYTNIVSPKNIVLIKFVLNDEKKISFPEEKEDGIYKDYKYNSPFSQFQVLVKKKKKKKLGIWNIKTKKIDLPAVYDEINIYDKNLILKTKGLYTSFPNIGTKPKYTKLEPYVGYFARFELPNGKKGWVDRKGKEYFDN